MDTAYATLILNSYEATSINTSKTAMTFSNVNFRFLLGDLYDKYEKFNIQLKTLITDQTSANIDADNSSTLIALGGPFFQNGNFNMTRKTNHGPNVCGALKLGENTTASFDSSGANILTFVKPTNTSDISLSFLQVKDGAIADGTFPNLSLVFQIWGVGEARNIDVVGTSKKLRVV